MGLLKLGKTLQWKDSLETIEYVKEHGITQLLNLYNANKEFQNDMFLFGDEIEYLLVEFDHENKRVYLSMRGEEVLHALNEVEEKFIVEKQKGNNPKPLDALWRPEYGRFMIEGTPGDPYTADAKGILKVEENMKKRREEVSKYLHEDEAIMLLSNFPILGAVKNFTVPEMETMGPIANSPYISDDLINTHIRFGTLTRNIRERRGANVNILAPLFMDEKTDPNVGHEIPTDEKQLKPCCVDLSEDCFVCSSPTQVKFNSTKETPTIHMDAMVFGMGSCCVQCTFSTRNLDSARNLYDQLVPCCPLLLALTASTPILRGLLAETDVRWYVIAGSVDDRTVSEQFEIKKSRYDSVSLYISDNEKAKINSDINPKISEKEYKRLKEAGLDDQLASHFAHLFIRDPLVVFDNSKEVDDSTSSEHFENIQSTNWQTCRFKPPPPNSNIGWRIEFRVMEVQLTDFENAAFTVFIALLTRIINTYDLDLYMPISKVDENMARAHKRDAVTTQKFYFRKSIKNDGNDEIIELTVNEAMNGSKNFIGLIPLMKNFLDSLIIDFKDRMKFENYLQFISDKASGKLQTTATFIRNFVLNHPKYNKDSKVTEEINYDLLKLCKDISSGKVKPKELF